MVDTDQFLRGCKAPDATIVATPLKYVETSLIANTRQSLSKFALFSVTKSFPRPFSGH